MPVYESKALLNGLYEETEHFLNKAVSEWQMIRHPQFGHKATPEKWSAAQCLAHLNSYGRYYLPAIEKAIQKAAKNKSALPFKAGWLGNYFTRMMLPAENGIPAKKMAAPKEHYPGIIPDSFQIVGEFIEQQEKLLKLIDAARNIDLNKAKCPISIAPFIKLKLGDVFLFLIAHNYRHVLQAERALDVAGVENRSVVRAFDLNKLGLMN